MAGQDPHKLHASLNLIWLHIGVDTRDMSVCPRSTTLIAHLKHDNAHEVLIMP